MWINFTDAEIRMLDHVACSDHSAVVTADERSTLQMLRGKTRLALVRVEARDEPARTDMGLLTPDEIRSILPELDELRDTINSMQGALDKSKRLLMELFGPLGEALQRWRESKTAGVNAADDALLLEISALQDRVDAVVRDAAAAGVP